MKKFLVWVGVLGVAVLLGACSGNKAEVESKSTSARPSLSSSKASSSSTSAGASREVASVDEEEAEKANTELRGMDGTYELVEGQADFLSVKIYNGVVTFMTANLKNKEIEYDRTTLGLDHTILLGSDLRQFKFDGKRFTIMDMQGNPILVFQKQEE